MSYTFVFLGGGRDLYAESTKLFDFFLGGGSDGWLRKEWNAAVYHVYPVNRYMYDARGILLYNMHTFSYNVNVNE